MFTQYRTPSTTNVFHIPNVSSPLSSSPLRASPTPSPLANRDVNVPSRASNSSSKDRVMSSPTPSHANGKHPPMALFSTTPSISHRHSSASAPLSPPPTRKDRESKFSKRQTKPNPLMNGARAREGEDGRETRRKLFLKRVKESADEKRWEARGGDDEIMRTLWIVEERRRAEKQNREAHGLAFDVDIVDEEAEWSLDEAMADEVALREEQELEALLMGRSQEERARSLSASNESVMLPEESMDSLLWELGNHGPNPERGVVPPKQPMDTPYGSDDEEYDSIFMDVIQQEVSRMASQVSPPRYADQDQDMMDMS